MFRLSTLFVLIIALACASGAWATSFCGGTLQFQTTSPLLAGTKNEPYGQTIEICGGSLGNLNWSIPSGSLPPGITTTPVYGCALNICLAGLALDGTPTQTGTYTFTVRVTDGVTTASKQYKMTVGLFAITTASPLPNATVYQPYSLSFKAAYGSGDYSWSLVSGSIPPGMTLLVCAPLNLCFPSNTLSGTPTSRGTYTFTMKVDDGYLSRTKQYSLTVN